MVTLIFLSLAIILHKKIGVVIALLMAAAVDLISAYIYMKLEFIEPIYIYYASIFLLIFVWWMATCGLKMTASQIVSGVALVIASVSVLDCYFSDGHETIISIAFPYLIAIINAATILAAWHDRNWTYVAYHNNSRKSADKNNKADICL